jgi:hypothetical protein
VTGFRAGAICLLAAALLACAAPNALAQQAAGTTGAQLQSTPAGTTGAQEATSCPTPRLSGLPKQPKFTNATIHFTLSNLTVGSTYLVTAGQSEVLGGVVQKPTMKNSFLMPDQGVKDKKIFVKAVLYSDSCDNAPWKLQKKISFKSTTPAPAATPPAKPGATPAATPAPVAPIAKPAVPVPPVKLPKVKLPKPITERAPDLGPPPSRRAWLTPVDGGARLDQKIVAPILGRLERKAEKANSSNALLGLGIFGAIFAIATLAGFMIFRRQDDVLFEKAQTEQLKHLEEGDPGLGWSEDPEDPMTPVEAPFAEDPQPPAEELVAATAAMPAPPLSEQELVRHRAEVEAELQRILTEAGIDAELEGILVDARAEAERHGIDLDPDLMLQALCEEINGSAKLSENRRHDLREMFSAILAEESQQASSEVEKVPAQ